MATLPRCTSVRRCAAWPVRRAIRARAEPFTPVSAETVDSLRDEGLSQAEAEAEAAWSLDDVDPDAQPLSFEDSYSLDTSLPEDVRETLLAAQYGPPVRPAAARAAPARALAPSHPGSAQGVLLAGFRLEEYAIVRAMLDQVGAAHVKVVPCSQRLLYATQAEALAEPEPNWEGARQEEWMRGGAWGSKRVALFSGLSIATQVSGG